MYKTSIAFGTKCIVEDGYEIWRADDSIGPAEQAFDRFLSN
jgi:hypothetical protein